MFDMFTRITESPEQTAELAVMVGKKIREGTILCMEGDLGAGKTLFVQSLAATLGVEGEVTSPTFNLMNIYEGICPILHFDLYRLETVEQLEDIGFFEYTEDPEGIVVIEWADKFPEAMPEDHVAVKFERTEKAEERRISFSCAGERNRELLEELDGFCRF